MAIITPAFEEHVAMGVWRIRKTRATEENHEHWRSPELRNRLSHQVLNDICWIFLPPDGCLVSRQVPVKRRCCALLPANISPAAIFVSTVRTLAACTRERKVGFAFQHYALFRHTCV